MGERQVVEHFEWSTRKRCGRAVHSLFAYSSLVFSTETNKHLFCTRCSLNLNTKWELTTWRKTRNPPGEELQFHCGFNTHMSDTIICGWEIICGSGGKLDFGRKNGWSPKKATDKTNYNPSDCRYIVVKWANLLTNSKNKHCSVVKAGEHLLKAPLDSLFVLHRKVHGCPVLSWKRV